MKKFNINNYQGKYAMYCKTEEDLKTFEDERRTVPAKKE